MPDAKKTAAPKTPTTTADPVANGGITQPGPNSSGGGSVIVGEHLPVDPSPDSGFGTLGFFTVDGEGCTVRFGIEQQQYVLEASSPNYSAMFSMLLACWLEGRRVSLTYVSPLLTGHPQVPDAPLRIVSLVTI